MQKVSRCTVVHDGLVEEGGIVKRGDKVGSWPQTLFTLIMERALLFGRERVM